MPSPASDISAESSYTPATRTAPVTPPVVELYTLFYLFARIGAQTFGGGATLLALLHRDVVQKVGYLTEAELATAWSLCAITPGINQIAITALIGHKLRGISGALVAVAGLLSVGAVATILVTFGYREMQARAGAEIEAALRGVVPATVGVGLITCWQLLRPQLLPKKGVVNKNFRAQQVQALVLCAAAAILLPLTRLPVVLLLLASGAMGMGTAWILSRTTRPAAEEAQP